MANLTKSQPNNITSPDGNSLAIFVDGVSGALTLKDVNGNVQPMSGYIGGSPFKYGSGTDAIQPVLGNNCASGNYSFIGGGFCNIASNNYSTVSGGNFITASGSYSTISGGYLITASNTYSVVGGGFNHISSGFASFVGGGSGNLADRKSVV